MDDSGPMHSGEGEVVLFRALKLKELNSGSNPNCVASLENNDVSVVY